MLDRFTDHNLNKKLFEPKTRLLLAVSGGVDSMVLANLLLKSGCKLALAHCNFQLRDEDSENDQQLIEQFAREQGIPIHVKRIDTRKLVEESNSSVQMVARDERYQFFEELMNEHLYDLTALAHNANDRVESLLINILRGTGIRGLQGMPIVRDKYIRPLLFAGKEEIREYARYYQIQFREDKSNLEVHYQRNWVRHRLLPMLKMRIPNIELKLLALCEHTANNMCESLAYLDAKVDEITTSDRVNISIGQLEKSVIPFTLLRELLNPLEFSSDQVFEAMNLLKSESGTYVENKRIRVLRDRNSIFIQTKSDTRPKPELSFTLVDRNKLKTLKLPRLEILVDAASVNSEKLLLRRWQKGDKFRPFGMKGWKKVSDFFIDLKLNLEEKENAWVLTYKNDIVWVVGMRMDDRFKVTDQTQKVLNISSNK